MSSNFIYEPSGLRISLAVLTMTAFMTLPFFTLEFGMASFTETTITSPMLAYLLFEPPSTLIDYFGEDWLLVIDESHVTIPQIKGMYKGDRSRKNTLIDFGFRLPSAADNRPLKC